MLHERGTPRAGPEKAAATRAREGAGPARRGRCAQAEGVRLNPLQAEKEVRVGNYYFHKGSYKAAVDRFREATKWNPNFAEAYVRLGEAEEKQKDWPAAREAYEKFLQLAEDDKRGPDIRKKVEKLSKGKR